MDVKRSYLAGTVTAALLLSGGAAFCCDQAFADEVGAAASSNAESLSSSPAHLINSPETPHSELSDDESTVTFASEYELVDPDTSIKSLELTVLGKTLGELGDGTSPASIPVVHMKGSAENLKVIEGDPRISASTSYEMANEKKRLIFKLTMPTEITDPLSNMDFSLSINGATPEKYSSSVPTSSKPDALALHELPHRQAMFDGLIKKDPRYERLKAEVAKLTPDNPLYEQYVIKSDKGEEAKPEIYKVNKCVPEGTPITAKDIEAQSMSSTERLMLNAVLYDTGRLHFSSKTDEYRFLSALTQFANSVFNNETLNPDDPTITVDGTEYEAPSAEMQRMAAATLADKLSGSFNAEDYRSKYVPDPWSDTDEFHTSGVAYAYRGYHDGSFEEGWNPALADQTTAYVLTPFESGKPDEETIFALRIQDPTRWAHESADAQRSEVYAYTADGQGFVLERWNVNDYGHPAKFSDGYIPTGKPEKATDGENFYWWISLPNKFLQEQGIVKIRYAFTTKYELYNAKEPNSHWINFYTGAKSQPVKEDLLDIWNDVTDGDVLNSKIAYDRDTIPHANFFDFVLVSKDDSLCKVETYKVKDQTVEISEDQEKATLIADFKLPKGAENLDYSADLKVVNKDQGNRVVDTILSIPWLYKEHSDSSSGQPASFGEDFAKYRKDIDRHILNNRFEILPDSDSPDTFIARIKAFINTDFTNKYPELEISLNDFASSKPYITATFNVPRVLRTSTVATQTDPEVKETAAVETQTDTPEYVNAEVQASPETQDIGVGESSATIADSGVQASTETSNSEVQATPETSDKGTGEASAHVSDADVQAASDTKEAGVGDAGAHVSEAGTQVKPETTESGITAKPDMAEDEAQATPEVKDSEAQAKPDTADAGTGDNTAHVNHGTTQTDAPATNSTGVNTDSPELVDMAVNTDDLAAPKSQDVGTQTEAQVGEEKVVAATSTQTDAPETQEVGVQTNTPETADKATNTDIENKADSATQTDDVDERNIALKTTPETGENKPISDVEKGSIDTEHGVEKPLPKTGDTTSLSYLFLGILGGIFALIKRIKSRKA